MTRNKCFILLAAATLAVLPCQPLVAQEADVPTKPRQVRKIGAQFAMRPDGEEVAAIRNFRKNDKKTLRPLDNVEFVSLKTGKVTGKLGSQGPVGDKTLYIFNDLTYSPDGKRLAWSNSDDTSNTNGVIVVRDIAGGKEWTLQEKDKRALGGPFLFSPDGKTLLSFTGGTSEVRFWDVESGELLGPPKGQHFRVGGHRPISYSPDGHTLYVRDGGDIVLRDGRTGEKKSVLANVKAGSQGMILSPDGKLFALAQAKIQRPKQEDVKGVVLWDIAADKEVMRFAEHQTIAQGFSLDGKLLLINQPIKSVRGRLMFPKTRGLDFVETETGKVRGTIRHAPNASFGGSCLFTPDGKTLLNYDINYEYVNFFDVPAAK